jgi:pSer/pThr/pTyr-binding forkhead associated (FHA) protein
VTGGELKRVLDAERAGDPFLVYRDDEGELRVHPLGGATERVTVGRRGSNDVPLPWDGQASRVHAVLERVGSEWALSDDGLSKNGTYVDGARVSARRRLTDRDVIGVGSTLLVFRQPAISGVGASNVGTLAPEGDAVTADDLTPTEQRILVALCRPFKHGRGFPAPPTNRQIADEVYLSVDAVKTHLRMLFRKFGVAELPQNQKRLQLVERALLRGLVNERDL